MFMYSYRLRSESGIWSSPSLPSVTQHSFHTHHQTGSVQTSRKGILKEKAEKEENSESHSHVITTFPYPSCF